MKLNYLMFTVMLATFVEKYCYYLIMPVLFVFLTKDFNLSGTQIGFVLALNGLSKIFISILNSTIIDKYSRYLIIYTGLSITIISYLSFPLINTYLGIICFSFFSSMGFALLTPTYKLFISSQEEGNKKFLFNLRYYLINIAAALGPLSASLLIFIQPQQLFIMVAFILFLNLCSFIYCFNKYPDSIDFNKADKKNFSKQNFNIPFNFYIILIALIFYSFAYNQMNSSFPIYLSTIFSYSNQFNIIQHYFLSIQLLFYLLSILYINYQKKFLQNIY